MLNAHSGSSRTVFKHLITCFMLYTIALVLIIAWLLGLVSSYTMGGFIHILLVVALVAVVVRLMQGKPVD